MCFHKNSKWHDILVFQYDGSYLLQGRKCIKCDRTQFRIVDPTPFIVNCEILTKEQLVDAGLWSPSRKNK